MTASDEAANKLLEGAYALETPADNLAYYRDFAHHYDASFADAMGYIYPGLVARHFMETSRTTGPILDVGCGTGLVAAYLRDGGYDGPIEGVDLSPDMLEMAASKDLYSALHECDLTAPMPELPRHYGALISAGTFTHGHIGPEPLERLAAHCLPGAVAVIGVNAVHYKRLGFAATLAGLTTVGIITAPKTHEVPIYDAADPSHAGDTAYILTFTIC